MTDYNNGEWHIWNGGERPVHPKTLVKIQIASHSRLMADIGMDKEARLVDWRGREALDGDSVTAFRVVKAYREPREFWLNQHTCPWGMIYAAYDNKEDADSHEAGRLACVHVREVLE